MKGMLMTPDNHRAIRDGRKTVTRRLDGLKEINQEPGKWILVRRDQMVGIPMDTCIFHNKETYLPEHIKPRYRLGEVVYIKEVWRVEGHSCKLGEQNIVRFQLDGVGVHHDAADMFCNQQGQWLPVVSKAVDDNIWQSPMFLPAHLAREFIQITEVRVERLQEIPLVDVKKEGIHEVSWSKYNSAIDAFKDLWDSLNAKGGYGWDFNPWNWRYEFKRIEL